MGEKFCKSDNCDHFCVMASTERITEIQELAKNPHYICFNCGRVADSDQNLCNPMKMD